MAVSYTVTDEIGATHSATLTITVTGTNDGPIAVVDTDTATEGGIAISGSVAANDTDADDGAILTYTLDAPEPAGLTFNSDGSYSFDPSHAAYNHLADGATLPVAVSYTVTDEIGATHSATLTITVTGTNDGPIAVVDTDTATEGGIAVSGSVAANDTDADDGAILTYTLDAPEPAGLTFNSDGSYSFDPSHAAYNHLADGATLPVAVSYTVTDEIGATHSATLTITVTGTNDGPIAVVDTDTATEGGIAVSGSVAANDTDADDGAILTYTLDAPEPAGLTFNSDGSYSFDPSHAAYNHLADGATLPVAVSYTVTDEIGATHSATLTITVTGTNDGPIAVVDTDTATEGGIAVSGSVAANDTDADDGAILTYTLDAPEPAGLTFNSDGSYSFDPSHAAYNHLADGATLPVAVSYTVTDEIGATHSATLTITVTGTNDGPIAVVDTFDALEENEAVSFDVLANDTDVDVGDTKTLHSIDSVNVTGLGALNGFETITLNGYFSIVGNELAFDPGAGAGLPGANAQSVFDRLDPGQTATVTVNYTMRDAAGSASTSSATFTVNGNSEIFLGTADADSLTGTQYVDEIDGLAGDDTMSGGQGNDIYYVDSGNDVVVENTNEGTDTVISTADYLLSANVENLTLTGVAVSGTGNSGANTLTGNAEDNVLDGAGGVDTYAGGLGGDTYFVDNTSELTRITENFEEGVDTIISRVNVTSLAANVENVVLEGTASNANGNALDNYINGNTLGNILDGGVGDDTLVGGLGNDTYVVDSSLDDVVEIGGQGTDLVRSTVATYTLTSDVENLTLLGTAGISGIGNSSNNVVTGNIGANTLDGGSGNKPLIGGDGSDTLIGGFGNDSLSGGTGADVMTGGDGDDVYYIDVAGDTVSETNAAAGGGVDRVFTSISYSLGANVEHLFLTFAPTALIDGTGNSLNNTIQGNNVANVINGLGGNDVLRGGLGSDTLTGGTGTDFFIFDTAFGLSNIDMITDFAVVDDTIQLENAIFTGLGVGAGTLAAAAFFVGAGAGDASDRIIYDNTTGNVFYDADGTGGTTQVQIAHLDAGLLTSGISNLDFQVI